MKKYITIIFLVILFGVLLTLGILAYIFLPNTSKPLSEIHAIEASKWQDLAKTDLAAINRYLDKYTTFELWEKELPVPRKRAYRRAVRRAKSVDDYGSYLSALQYYVGTFKDYHITLAFTDNSQNSSSAVSWPGIIIAWDNAEGSVQHIANSRVYPELAVGNKVISCDGKSLRRLARLDIVKFSDAQMDFPSTWHRYLPYLLLDYGNPWYHRPEACKFRLNNGKEISYPLNWGPIDNLFKNNGTAGHYNLKQIQKQIDTLVFERPDFSVENLNNKIIKLSIPSFSHDYIDANGVNFQHWFDKVRQISSSEKEIDYVLIDVRGNAGGDPGLVKQLLLELFGDIKHYPYLKWGNPQTVIFNSDPENVEYFAKFEYLTGENKVLKNALEQHQDRAVYENYLKPDIYLQKNTLAGKKNTLIFMDERCGSACAWFVRSLINMPSVILMGQPTTVLHPTSYYRVKPLPSGLLELGFPVAYETSAPPQLNSSVIAPDFFCDALTTKSCLCSSTDKSAQPIRLNATMQELNKALCTTP